MTRSFSQDDIDAFGLASGATGLIHTEPEYAAMTRFRATLVPGILLAAVVQQALPECWTWWTSDLSVRSARASRSTSS